MQPIVGFYWTPSENVDEIEQQLDLIVSTGANTVVIPHRALERVAMDQLQAKDLHLCVDWTIFAGEDLRQAYPDSVPVDDSGAAYERDDWYVPVCPNHQKVRQQHLQGMDQVLARYGEVMSGLWLDFIRYPVRWESNQPRLRQLCFCPTCLDLFLGEQRGGYSQAETQRLAATILQERREEWVDWKCSRVINFVQEVRARIMASLVASSRVIDGSLRLGMFSLPWRRSDWDNALRTIAAQDLGRLAAYVDVISPMVYHKLCQRPVTWITEVTEDAAGWAQQPVLPVIQSMDRPETMAASELDAALGAALEAPSSLGALIFTLEPLVDNAGKADVVRQRFRAPAQKAQ